MRKVVLGLILSVCAHSAMAFTWSPKGPLTNIATYNGCNESAGKKVLWVTQGTSTWVATSVDEEAFETFRTDALLAVTSKMANVQVGYGTNKRTVSIQLDDNGLTNSCVAYQFPTIYSLSIAP